MKIKKYLSLIILPGFVLLFNSCTKFLDRQPDNQINEQAAFSNWDQVNGAANRLYRDMRDRDRGIVGLQDFSISGITDECKRTQVEQAIPD